MHDRANHRRHFGIPPIRRGDPLGPMSGIMLAVVACLIAYGSVLLGILMAGALS